MGRLFASFVFLFATVVCCDRPALEGNPNPLLARVHSKELHLIDLGRNVSTKPQVVATVH